MDEPLRVLFVCTAKICRSPAAELIARQRIGEFQHLFRSAGFLYDGREMADPMQTELARRGLAGSTDHRSHIVDPDTLAAADLVLTMESAHLQDLVVKDRAYFDKTIPLREAAERLDSRTPLPLFLAELSTRQPSAYLDDRWDIADPYKRSPRHYRDTVELLDELVTTVFTNLELDVTERVPAREPLF